MPKQKPNQQHHLIRTQTLTQTLSQNQLRTQRLHCPSSFPFLGMPWPGENCFDETSESSTRSPHASYDTSSFSCHPQNLSSYLLWSWIHASLIRNFWRIGDVCLRNLCVNVSTCGQLPTEGNQQCNGLVSCICSSYYLWQGSFLRMNGEMNCLSDVKSSFSSEKMNFFAETD